MQNRNMYYLVVEFDAPSVGCIKESRREYGEYYVGVESAHFTSRHMPGSNS